MSVGSLFRPFRWVQFVAAYVTIFLICSEFLGFSENFKFMMYMTFVDIFVGGFFFFSFNFLI